MITGGSFEPSEPHWPGEQPTPRPSNAPWYLLRAATRQERRACDSLTELGIEHYLPCETVERRLGRGKVVVERALFPGYLFARVPDELFHVAISADGVHAPVRKTDAAGERRPCCIAPSLVIALQVAEASGEFDRTKTPPMSAGDMVRITEGPFEGRVGELLKLKSDDRVKLLIEGYGKTTIAASMVELAA